MQSVDFSAKLITDSYEVYAAFYRQAEQFESSKAPELGWEWRPLGIPQL